MKSEERILRVQSPLSDDVHQLRGIRLKGLNRDPGYFLGDLQVDPAHLQECFDADTLFYDVFFEPTNRHLVAVGPPLGNLHLDLEICVNGEPINLDVIKHAASRMHLVRGGDRIAKQNDIRIKANAQTWELSVPANNTGTSHKFTLCTVQKDNREHWIKDWIEHYRKIGVDRVILYDNNSEKLPDVDAIVIPCPYKFGLSKYASIYRGWAWKTDFLQRSLLTICGYKYQNGHLLNFDIDELLQVKSLRKFKWYRLVYFNSCFVETKTEEKLPEDYSFRHFVYRNAYLRNQDFKYIIRMNDMLCCSNPHVAVLKNSIPKRVVSKLQRLWQYQLENIRSYLKSGLAKKVMSIWAPPGEDVPRYKTHPRWPEGKPSLPGKDVFYHYKAINTGWKVDRSSFDEATEVVKIENSQPYSCD